MSTLNWVCDTIMLNVQRALCARRDYQLAYAVVLMLGIGTQNVMAVTPLPAVAVAVVTSATPDSALQFLGRVEAIQAVDVTTLTEGFIATKLVTTALMLAV